MTARLSGWYAWRRIGSEKVECVQYAEDTWFAARAEASRACGVEAMGLVCSETEPPELSAEDRCVKLMWSFGILKEMGL